MVRCFEVTAQRTMKEMPISMVILHSTKVFLVLDNTAKNIYLWNGHQAGVMRRTLGVRFANELRTEYGTRFKIVKLIQGREPQVFISLFTQEEPAPRVLDSSSADAGRQPPTSVFVEKVYLVVCPFCGHKNMQGQRACEKCSGDL